MTSYEKYSLLIQGFFLIAGVLTVIVYYRQLNAMQGQLQALIATSTRESHLELLKFAISDDEIREVWHAEEPGLDSKQFKQHIFVNLHLAHLDTLFELERLTKEHLEAALKCRFANRYYREFWQRARPHWFAHLPPGTSKERTFFSLCERAYSEASAQHGALAEQPKAAGR